MTKGKIFIISGPSGSGKTTLHNKLLSDAYFRRHLIKSISVTTRPRRKGEVNGRDYIFVSRKMFEYKIRANHFLEYEKVFSNYYGTPQKNVSDLLNSGHNVLLCIDVKGARKVYRKFKNAVTIFIKTPTWDDLKQRLKTRDTDDEDTISLRLKVAKEELLEAKNYEYVIVNDDLETAVQRLKTIIREALSLSKD